MQYLKAVTDKMFCSINAASSAVELIASADLMHHAMTVYRSGDIDEHTYRQGLRSRTGCICTPAVPISFRASQTRINHCSVWMARNRSIP
jgi:hypothetical protein